jgi:acyl carrier protein
MELLLYEKQIVAPVVREKLEHLFGNGKYWSADSLDRVELMMEWEDAMGKDIPLPDEFSFESLAVMVDFIVRHGWTGAEDSSPEQ